MTDFKQTFNRTQQFLILQAYIDSKLTEQELLSFTLVEAVDGFPVVFYSAGVMIIYPKLEIDQFTHDFFPRNVINVQQENDQLTVTLPDRTLRFHLTSAAEAEQLVKDLTYLFAR